MDPSSRRKSSSEENNATTSARQHQSRRRSSAGKQAASEATPPQQAPQASSSGQRPPHDLTASTSPNPQETPASGPLTPDWFHDERWATLLALESTSLSPSTLQPQSLPPTAQQPPNNVVQRAPGDLTHGETTGAALRESRALLPHTPSTDKLAPIVRAAADEASSRSAERHTEQASVEAGEQSTILHSDSQEAVTEAATPAAQPSRRPGGEETTPCHREGTGAEITQIATRAARPSTPTELSEVASRGPDGQVAEHSRDVLSGSQPSVTANPPQPTSMSHESTDAEIGRVIDPIALSSGSTSLPETTLRSPDGTNAEVARTVTLITPSSASSGVPETTPRSQEGADDVGVTRITTPQAQPSAPKSVLKVASRSLESTVATLSGAPSALSSLPQTPLQSPEGNTRVARKRRRSEDDSNVSQRGSEALTTSRSTPSTLRILEDGVTSASHRIDSAGATTSVDVGQSASTQRLPTPLDGRKRRRRRKSEPAIPSMSALPGLYGTVLDATADSVVSVAVDTGGVSWSTEAKARGLLFTLLHCLSQALLNILIKQVVHIPKTKIAYYVAFGYMLGSMPEAFALKNPFGPRYSQVDVGLRGLSSLMSLMLKAEALRYVAVSDLAVAYSTVPVFVMLLSWYFMDEKMGLTMWASVWLCLCGIVVVMRPAVFFKEWDEETSQTRLIGFLYAFGSALSLVIMIVLYRLTRNATTKFLGFNSGLTRTIMALFMMMATGRFDEVMDGRYLATLVMMSKLSFCAIFFLNKALQKESGAFVTTVKFSADIIMSVILQIAFLDLYPDVWSMAGIMLVALSFMLPTCGNTVKPAWKHRRRRQSIQKRRESLKVAEEQALTAMAAAPAAETGASCTSTAASTDTVVQMGTASGAASVQTPRN
ncbi:hypothetical protein HPB52_020625 [Rhipicephalus sanguineus]|uniref:EamA domain-containing protein n=1 Tax=Rhipicephalus sanguineus TaxID=34632 RepID=A0A9D4Q591_RHISA|nr:hypothetical protein HPB52_020625 [Rhipicephalus sanguineus]